MRPERRDIAIPEARPGTRWVGGEPGSIVRLAARGPVLVHFFDLAQLNSVRALPYVRAWDRRYRDAGLSVLGVHSPRFPFTAAAEALEAGLPRLELEHPVADDSGYAIWHDYGCHGWPSLFLWGRGGALRWYHFGEGEYEATEEAIQEELAAGRHVDFPAPLEPLRPSDAPDARVIPPTEEMFPGGSPEQAWKPASPASVLELSYAAGGAYVAADGTGELRVSIDRGEEAAITVDAPGLYELATHPRHSEHTLRIGADPGVRVWAVSFAAGVP